MACKLCMLLCNWLCRDDGRQMHDLFWDQSTAWERAQSNEWELWSEDAEANRTLIERGCALEAADPAAALRAYVAAAEAGSVWAMEMVAWHHHAGSGVTADFGKAQEYYHRALSAGSWMATIGYARLLETHGHFERCEAVLRDGVQADFVPAFFWLAWFRYKRSPNRRTCREIRPLFERAAEAGHPGAELMLARLMARGRFGIREIPKGFGGIRKLVSRQSSSSGERGARNFERVAPAE